MAVSRCSGKKRHPKQHLQEWCPATCGEPVGTLTCHLAQLGYKSIIISSVLWAESNTSVHFYLPNKVRLGIEPDHLVPVLALNFYTPQAVKSRNKGWMDYLKSIQWNFLMKSVMPSPKRIWIINKSGKLWTYFFHLLFYWSFEFILRKIKKINKRLRKLMT